MELRHFQFDFLAIRDIICSFGEKNMYNENICLFVPYHKDYQSIHTVNFVLETKPQNNHALKTESLYKMHYVSEGSGVLRTMSFSRELSRGDIFFTFAGTPYCIESGEGLRYMYISFLGTRANMIMEKLSICPQNAYFTGFAEAEDFWLKGLEFGSESSDLISESVLLYTFAKISERLRLPEKKCDDRLQSFLNVKKFIDDNCYNPDLSLGFISDRLSYNAKYLSSLFKKNAGVGISEYVTTVRIQNACSLIDNGMTCVGEIASLSGYGDALYFSKVFKKKTGLSPKDYIIERQNNYR